MIIGGLRPSPRDTSAGICLVSGPVLRSDNTPVTNGTVTFNSSVAQSFNGVVMQPLILSSITDSQGNMTPISLVQGMVVQVYVSDNGRTYAPMMGLVPMSSTATFSQVVTL